jgi:type II secretory pathway pseudopilin PulG
MVTIAFMVFMLLCAAIGVIAAVRGRRRVTDGTAIAITWLSVAAGIIFFGIFVDPVWFYSAHLALILWISVGLLPHMAKRRSVGLLIFALAILAILASSVAQNFRWYSSAGAKFESKYGYLSQSRSFSNELLSRGAQYVYGSYYDVLPLGYSSASKLRAISSTYNRFPLSRSERASGRSVGVAVNNKPTDPWGVESLARLRSECNGLKSVVKTEKYEWAIFDCPIKSLE